MQEVQAQPVPHKPRVLVVEDNPTLQALLRIYLRNQYETVVASNTEQALETASNHAFDAFLIDIQLEDKWSGVDFLKELQSMRPYRRTPKIACTALSRRGDRERFLGVGFDGFLSKPFRKQELLSALQSALEPEAVSLETLPEAVDFV